MPSYQHVFGVPVGGNPTKDEQARVKFVEDFKKSIWEKQRRVVTSSYGTDRYNRGTETLSAINVDGGDSLKSLLKQSPYVNSFAIGRTSYHRQPNGLWNETTDLFAPENSIEVVIGDRLSPVTTYLPQPPQVRTTQPSASRPKEPVNNAEPLVVTLNPPRKRRSVNS